MGRFTTFKDPFVVQLRFNSFRSKTVIQPPVSRIPLKYLSSFEDYPFLLPCHPYLYFYRIEHRH